MKFFFLSFLIGCQSLLTDYEVVNDTGSSSDSDSFPQDTAPDTETGTGSDSETIPGDTAPGTDTGIGSDSETIPGDTAPDTDTGSETDPTDGYNCSGIDVSTLCDAHYCETMADCYGDCRTFADCWLYYCPPGTPWDGWMYITVCPP